MKKLLAIAVLATSAVAYSAQNTAVNDLQYLPDAGTIFGDTSYNRISFSDERTGIESTLEGFLLRQQLGYSLMNNFSLTADFGYTDTTSKTEGFSSTDTSGLSDIGIFGKFRAIDADTRLDLLANVTLSPGDSEVDSDGDVNGYSGGHTIAVGAEYGAKLASHQWSVRALYTYLLETTEKDKSTGTTETFKDDAHSQLNFGVNLLTRLAESSFVKTSAAVEFEQEYEDDTDETTPGTTNYTLGAEYQQLISQDLYLRGGFQALLGGSGDSTVIMLYTLGAGYQF